MKSTQRVELFVIVKTGFENNNNNNKTNMRKGNFMYKSRDSKQSCAKTDIKHAG